MPGTASEAGPRPGQLVAYAGPSVLLTDLSGQVTGPGDGYFLEDARLISDARVEVNGAAPRSFSASRPRSDTLVTRAQVADDGDLLEDALFVEQRWELAPRGLRWSIRATNHAPHRPRDVHLRLTIGADFRDFQQALQDAGAGRRGAGLCAPSSPCGDGAVRFPAVDPALGLAMVARPVAGQTALAWADGRFAGDAQLGPGECATWALGISREPPALPQSAIQYTAAVPRPPVAPRLTSPNSAVAKAWETAVADLASLPLGLEFAPYALAAGVPLYVHFFGRDTLTAGWQALLAAPEYLRDALVANAALQGEQTDDWLDEQPGKMIHEVRTGPLSLLGKDPLLRYYGDYATPPDFVAMLAQYWTWTADTATVRKLLPAAWRALDWLERDGDLDGDGFLEYVTRSSAGVKNQGWKDAPESVVDDAGKIAANPLATSELQGYWYAALQLGALLAAVVSRDFLYAARLGARARRLRRQFNKQFWLEDEGHYALALDREKRPIRAAGSNDAHLLVTGIVPRERARRLVNRLFEPDIFTGWGIRTLSSDHPAYNPFSYHRGSVWPVEHGTFALGLARYGFWDELGLLARAVFDAAALCPEHRLPEVLGGLQRDGNDSLPGVYPNACSPQAWSASTVVMLVQALLGLNPAAPLGAAFVDPHLPAWLPNLRLDGVRIGAATVDLQAWRTSSGTTSFRVTRRDGRLAVLRQPPPNDPRGKLFRRLAGLVPHR